MPTSRTGNLLNDSKKGYSLREKFDILHYIINNNAYGEIRGRSFWISMEKSKITTRTWQSLKEVFLKRILPDLHNPYYKLSQDQIRNFSRSSSKPSEKTNWIEKNKTMDNVFNRSMSDQNESVLSGKKSMDKNLTNSPRKSLSNKSTSESNDIEIASSNDVSESNTENPVAKDKPRSVRILRKRDNENNSNVGTSQSSQDIESFPMNNLPSSTPRKGFSNNTPSKQNINSTPKSNNTPSKQNISSTAKSNNTPSKQNISSTAKDKALPSLNNAKTKTPTKQSAEEAKNDTKNDEKSTEKSPDENRSFSPNILLLSSESSLSEDANVQKKDKSKKNLFGFAAVKTNTSMNQVTHLSSETDISSSDVAMNDVRPSTSIHVSPSLQNKLKQQSFLQGTSSDSDDEEGSSSDSQYTYYRSTDSESLKRKGKKLYGLFRGKLVPLYEPKKKCCKERKELIANGKISKKQIFGKSAKNKCLVYLDNDLEPVSGHQMKNAHKGRLNERGNNSLSKEVLNFWKLKYLSLKRRNDEIMRLLAKEQNENCIDSVTKMLSDPVSNKLRSQNDHEEGNIAHVDGPKSSLLAKRKANFDTEKEGGSGKKFMVATKSSHQPGTSKAPAQENDNVIVIDSQKADIIIDILKKVSEINHTIDPVQVNKIMNSPAINTAITKETDKVPNPTTNLSESKSPGKDTGIKHKHSILNTNSIDKVSEEISKLRERENKIFEKIKAAKPVEESNPNRDEMFSKSQLEMLFNENGKDKRSKDISDKDDKDQNQSPKVLRSSNTKSESSPQLKPQSEQKSDTIKKVKVVEESKSFSKTADQPNIESQPESFKKTSNIPESMDIEDSVKFAINPKFFSILFPNESKNKDKDSNDTRQIVVSSDDESDIRYALPKTSTRSDSLKQKKLKNRRSTGKVIKLKMFTNIKKDKRQSLNVNEPPDIPDQRSNCERNDEEEQYTHSRTDSDESSEIPLQNFTLKDINLESLENMPNKTFCINECCSLENPLITHENDTNMNKPLLQQDLKYAVIQDDARNNNCQFCVSPEDTLICEPLEDSESQSDVTMIESAESNDSEKVDVIKTDQAKRKESIVVLCEEMDNPDIPSVLLNISNISLFSSLIGSDMSSINLDEYI